MNRVIGRSTAVKGVMVILALAGMVVIGRYAAQTFLTAPLGAGTRVEAPQAAEGEEAAVVEDASPEEALPAQREWSPEEIGAGSSIIVASNGGFAPGEDYMNLGRYLERERTLEGSSGGVGQAAMREVMRQNLTTAQADDAPVSPDWPEDDCEPASSTGPQPCD